MRLIFLLVLVFGLNACGDKEQPSGLLTEDEMVVVLIDIHFTEGVASAMPIPYDSSQVLYSLLERDVFEKHQVSDSVFNESLMFYLQDPEVMNGIYSRVIDSLSYKESSGGLKDKF